ncbi:DUF6655 family protein [Allorhodopirellula solitaria]|uniref:Lipoprotein n=1 Tax=Allorhodopirellula solitaria TaxID=2527987 RepID=A0A5C5XU58_9BACT|nr:DUF6655 family protein [Allorhodopirellula solitaria]TWT66424.1 hypothetical protein CA85_25180 [Allorhodopirellula solitaria]
MQLRTFSRLQRWTGLGLVVGSLAVTGCRSTVTVTDTSRTASAQLLLNSTADAVIRSFDFAPLCGRLCYLDTNGLGDTGGGYLVYRLREEMGLCGVRLAESRDDAEVVVEAGLAVYGTDSYNSTIGVTDASNIPDVNLCVRDTQFGVSKISLFAVQRDTGEIIWRSGTMRADSRQDIRNTLGMGPYFSGTIVHPANRVGQTDSAACSLDGSCFGLSER